jgi:hypothetical protein
VDSSEDRFEPVLITGKPHEIDMAVDTLKQSGIPYQTREETSTGLKLAMPVMRAPGPGTFFSVLVPAKAMPQAQRALAALPFEITTKPGHWDFGPAPAAKQGLRIYAIVVIICVVLSLAYTIIRAVF